MRLSEGKAFSYSALKFCRYSFGVVPWFFLKMLPYVSVSWKVRDSGSKRAVKCRLRLAADAAFSPILLEKEGADLRSTGETLDVPLRPRTRYYLRVEVRGDVGDAAEAVGAADETLRLRVHAPRLWNGLGAAQLYTVRAVLCRDGEELDEVSVRTGFRRVTVDAERGLVLNGEKRQLHGVAKHQDIAASFNAVSDAQIAADFDLISEIGANAVRLSHYQHAQAAYDEADERGLRFVNGKGLVTRDREIRKDAFYYYKARWSDEPFVHLCARRFEKRCAETVDVKVYTNRPEVWLTVNGEAFGTGENRGGTVLFRGVPLVPGENRVEARAGICEDALVWQRVETPEAGYALPDSGEGSVKNWFLSDDDITRQGYFSINDTANDVLDDPKGRAVLEKYIPGMVKVMDSGSIPLGLTVKNILSFEKGAVSPETIKEINKELNQIENLF